jgi:5-methylcytosine-specific restriction endonuclease McrA
MNMNRWEYPNIDLGYDEEPVLVCGRCGTVHSRSPKPHEGRIWRTCDECDDRTEHEYDTRPMEPREAAAELAVRRLDNTGCIHRAERRGYVFSIWVSDRGVNLMNHMNDWDLRVHEVGPIEAYTDKIQEKEPDATTYVNGHVHGFRDDPKGYALPTHGPGKAGPVEKDPDDMTDEVLRLCEIAGLETPQTA